MEAKDYIAAIRKKGFTQAQIAEKTGIPQPSISKIERGDVDDVMSRNYRALQTLYEEIVVNAKPPAADRAQANGNHTSPSDKPDTGERRRKDDLERQKARR